MDQDQQLEQLQVVGLLSLLNRNICCPPLLGGGGNKLWVFAFIALPSFAPYKLSSLHRSQTGPALRRATSMRQLYTVASDIARLRSLEGLPDRMAAKETRRQYADHS